MESSAVCAPRQMDASRVDALQHAGLQMGRSSRMCGAHGGRAHHGRVRHGTVESGELSTGNALAGRAESAIGSAARRPFSMK